jgi:FixJ family two-component response regulator
MEQAEDALIRVAHPPSPFGDDSALFNPTSPRMPLISCPRFTIAERCAILIDVPRSPAKKRVIDHPKQLGLVGPDNRRMDHAGPPPGAVLILDDEESVRRSCSRLARSMRAVPYVAHSEESALEVVAKHKLAAMVVDVNLGNGGNGLAFLRRAKERECDAAVMVFSGMPDNALQIAPYRLGATFVPKPVEPAVLLRFFRVAARWPAYHDTLTKIVRHFARHAVEESRLTDEHILLVKQYLFFGHEDLNQRLGISASTRKRQQQPLTHALGIERLHEIWEVLSLFEGATDFPWGAALASRRATPDR